MRQRPTAIGYLRTDVSGVSQAWDELAKTVTFGAHTDFPVSRLLDVVRRMDVDAVITPSLEHLGGDVPGELVRVCEINTVTPPETYAPPTPFRFVDVDEAETC